MAEKSRDGYSNNLLLREKKDREERVREDETTMGNTKQQRPVTVKQLRMLRQQTERKENAEKFRSQFYGIHKDKLPQFGGQKRSESWQAGLELSNKIEHNGARFTQEEPCDPQKNYQEYYKTDRKITIKLKEDRPLTSKVTERPVGELKEGLSRVERIKNRFVRFTQQQGPALLNQKRIFD